MSVINDEFWSLLREDITLDDLNRKQRSDAAARIIETNLRKLGTRALLSMRRDPPWGLVQQVIPEDIQRWRDVDVEGILQTVLRQVLKTREHVPSGAEARAHRRRMAQQHHGSKRLRKRCVTR
jgi:hypothetical protein